MLRGMRKASSNWGGKAIRGVVVACLAAPAVGFSVVFGMSAHRLVWWDNASARHLGFRPHDSSEPFRAAVEARQQTIDLADPAAVFQGGAFVSAGPFE